MNNHITGSSGYIGHKPTKGQSGYSGHSGTAGPGGTNILQQVESIINKFNNRFILNEYKVNVHNDYLPQFIIVDNFTLKEHQFDTISMIDLIKDFQSFLNNIIIVERDTKINNLLQ